MKFLRSAFALLLFSCAAFAAEELLPSYTLTSYVSSLGSVIYSADIPGDPEIAVRVTFLGGLSAEGTLMGSGLAFLNARYLSRAIERARFAPDCPWQEVKVSVELNRDSLEISLSGLREPMKEALKAVFAILGAPGVSEEEFLNIRDKLSADMAECEEEEKYALLSLWRRTAFDTIQEAAPMRGYSAQIAKLTITDLEKYQKCVFVSGNASLAMAGSLFGFGMEECVKECLAKLPEGVFLKDDRLFVNEERGSAIAMRTSKGQDSFVCAGFVLRPTASLGTAPALTFARILKKRVPELEKRLASEFQQRIPVEFCQEEELSGLSLKVFCKIYPVDCPKARIIIRDWLMEAARQKFSEQEVRGEADLILSELASECASSEGVAKGLIKSSVKKGGPFGLQDRARSLKKLGPDSLRRYCDSNLRSSDLVMVWSDPVEKLEPRAAEFLRLEREILENIGYQHYKTVLPGKAELVIQKREDETMVRCAFIALGGNWYEETFNNGIFAVLSEFLSSCSADPEGFKKTLRECGASIFPLFEPQIMGFQATVPASRFKDLLPYLCRAWTNPKFTKEGVEEASQRALARLGAQNTNYMESAEMLLRQTLFPEHPYSLDRYGNPFVIERIRSKDIADFYREYVTPDNTAIVISGPVNEKETALLILKESKEFFSKERGLSQKERLPQKPRLRSAAKPLEELKPEKEKSFTAPEKEAMGIAGNILPGFEKGAALPYFISYLMEKTFRRGMHEIKEKYGEDALGESGFEAYPGYGAGYWCMYFRMDPKLAEEASLGLQALCDSALSNALSQAEFVKEREAASKGAALYARRAPDFMKRSYRRTLFSTNEWPDLIQETQKLELSSLSNYFLKAKSPARIMVLPDKNRL